MSGPAGSWVEQAFGVVVVVGRTVGPDAVAWAAGWAAETDGVPLTAWASRARLVVTGVAHDFPARPSESDLLALAGRPLVLVPMAA